METEKGAEIEVLHDYMLIEIFCYLDLKSLNAARLTCNHWVSIIDDSETLWKMKSFQATDDAQYYIRKTKLEGSSWKDSFQINYGDNLLRRKWLNGEFSQPKCYDSLPKRVMCPMSAETWGVIFDKEMKSRSADGMSY